MRTVATQQRVAATSIAGTSYDPLLERHIGTMVVVEVTSADGTVDEYIGIFKEYSTQFLEVMDVHVHEGESSRMCDLIVPRAHSVVRHSAEPVASPLPNPEAPVPAG
ncbi:MAG: hypothetical protein FJ316_06235 [SAR202 cluster bacterium]|nr:hypothetical protein [SAR202 cluster bacterium]